jgi:arsenite methyltransferase
LIKGEAAVTDQSSVPIPETDDLTATVRARYGAAAERVLQGSRAECCGPVSCGCGAGPANGTLDPITSDLYRPEQTAVLPADAVLASLGCGNPTALAPLHEGEVVLDLGSGGGIDVLLSARRVGPSGKAYGLDMTDEMLTLARANAAKAGATNVEFLRGHIEAIPLPDASVDVIISNCVINLSADKRRVLQEAFRVLKPGGRFAVSDVVVRGEIPDQVRKSMELWVGCVAGALEEQEFLRLLREAGFANPSIEPTRIYQFSDAKAFLGAAGEELEQLAQHVTGRVMGAFVRASKGSGGREMGGSGDGVEREGTPSPDRPVARSPGQYRVLFVCTGNSARSQMAQTILNQKGRGRFVAESAGSEPAARVHPLAVSTLESHGYFWTGHAPQGLDRVQAQPWDFVITVCDRARESCPVFPGQPVLAHWGMPDPAHATGTEAERQRAFTDTLLLISRRIDLLLALPIEKLEKLALQKRVGEIGQVTTLGQSV